MQPLGPPSSTKFILGSPTCARARPRLPAATLLAHDVPEWATEVPRWKHTAPWIELLELLVVEEEDGRCRLERLRRSRSLMVSAVVANTGRGVTLLPHLLSPAQLVELARRRLARPAEGCSSASFLHAAARGLARHGPPKEAEAAGTLEGALVAMGSGHPADEVRLMLMR